jgi:DNA-binding LacI/PurR family transcriptional regulator
MPVPKHLSVDSFAKANKVSGNASAPSAVTRLQMADVAKIAGVSVATVSRALSGSTLTNQKTAQRVRDIAESLNYSINIAAKNFRLQHNRTIAVVLPFDFRTAQSASDPFFISLLGSVADAITARGYEMLLSRVNAEQIFSVAQLVHTGRAVGIILIGQWHQHDQLNRLGAQGLPLVVWGAHLHDQTYSTVGSDNVLGGKLAAEHLLKLGCKRIAFFGDTELPEVKQRFNGFEKTLKLARYEFSAELFVPAPFVAESGKHAVEHLLKRQVSFDGIFACSDLLAMTAIQALQQVGKLVPNDVAVVGYDDVPVASFFRPTITTISQHVESAGEALVHSLLERINDNKVPYKLLKTELIARESTGTDLPRSTAGETSVKQRGKRALR